MATLEEFRQALYGKDYDLASFKPAKMVGTSLPWAVLTSPHVKEVCRRYEKDLGLDLGQFPLNETVEMTVSFFIISLRRIPDFKSQMRFLQRYLKFADSWMITDALGPYLRKHRAQDFLPYYEIFIESPHLYERRFAYVHALSFYREEDVTPFIEGIRFSEEYYLYMAEAWMLATFGITHFEQVSAYLKQKDVPLSLKRKAISKMRDSYRISSEEKEILKQIRDNL